MQRILTVPHAPMVNGDSPQLLSRKTATGADRPSGGSGTRRSSGCGRDGDEAASPACHYRYEVGLLARRAVPNRNQHLSATSRRAKEPPTPAQAARRVHVARHGSYRVRGSSRVCERFRGKSRCSRPPLRREHLGPRQVQHQGMGRRWTTRREPRRIAQVHYTVIHARVSPKWQSSAFECRVIRPCRDPHGV
jgi:hypothetical protein